MSVNSSTEETVSLITESDREQHDNEENVVNMDEGATELRIRRGDLETDEREDADSTLDAGRGARRARQRTEEEDETPLKYGPEQLLLLVVPVSICMIVVVATVLSIKSYTSEDATLVYIPYNEKTGSSSSKLGHGFVNALAFVGIVLVMTIVLVVLYKYKCYKALFGWLIGGVCLLMFLFSGLYLVDLFDKYNTAMDWISFFIIVWNFGVVGMVSIFWKGPLRLMQFYHIITSALIALILIKYLPDFTTWIILGALVLYDLWAVCCPHGPLRVLVETAKERGDRNLFQSLIYSTTMMWSVTMAENETQSHTAQDSEEDCEDESDSETSEGRPAGADDLSSTSSEASAGGQRRKRRRRPESNDEEDSEGGGARLGLGDFIFYSVLLGRAAYDSDGDWNVILACYICVVIGLGLTTLLLSMIKRALPALPISVTFGVIFYFATSYLISPFVSALAQYQVFI